MGDFGLKITKKTKDITSETIGDYIFSSKYQSLPLLYKAQVSLAVNGGGCSGTFIYTHNLGFKPFCLAFTTSQAGGGRQAIPFIYAQDFNKFTCSGDNLEEQFTTLRIKDNTIEINYNIGCIVPMVGERCPDSSLTYTIDLYVFMFELGSTT